MPKDRHPSILEFVCTWIFRPGTTERGDVLPDKDRIPKDKEGLHRWVSGTIDGLITRRPGPQNPEDQASAELVNLVTLFCVEPTVSHKAQVYQHLLSHRVALMIWPGRPVVAAKERESQPSTPL